MSRLPTVNQSAAKRWIDFVARRVAYYFRFRRSELKSDLADELLAQGVTALCDFLVKEPNCSRILMRRVVDQALQRAEQTDSCLYVPPDTRRKRVNRGDDPGDFTRHSYTDNTDEHGNHIFWIDDLNYEVVLAPLPEWRAYLQTEPVHEQSIRIREYYDIIYGLCQNENELLVLEASLDRSELNDVAEMHPDDLMPPHEADIAAETGLSRYRVQICRKELEDRIWELRGKRKPTAQRVQRPRM